MGDWWVGGSMRWGTNEMGDQWDGGPLRLAEDGVTNEKGDQWDGAPVIWGTNEMGDQWAPIMYWGTNELGDQWEGDQLDGGPMRWGTSERIPWVCIIFWYHQNIGYSYFNRQDFPFPLLSNDILAAIYGTIDRAWVGCCPGEHIPPDDCGIPTCNSNDVTRSAVGFSLAARFNEANTCTKAERMPILGFFTSKIT